jgi:hypothetical protein
MKFAQRFLLVATAFAALVTSSFADQNPVGTWKGKVLIDTSKMKKVGDPQQQAMIEKGIAAGRNMVITIVMKANKTYVASMSGGPQSPPDSGTWSLKGNTVTMTSNKKNGKSQSQPFTLSADGKTMSMSMPPMMGATAKVVFKR